MRGQCRVGLVETRVEILFGVVYSNAVKSGECKRSAEPSPLPCAPLCGTAPGRWLIHEQSVPERLPHWKPGTAGGQYRMRLLCAVAAAPILARSDRQCTRVTATLEYGAQAIYTVDPMNFGPDLRPSKRETEIYTN